MTLEELYLPNQEVIQENIMIQGDLSDSIFENPREDWFLNSQT